VSATLLIAAGATDYSSRRAAFGRGV